MEGAKKRKSLRIRAKGLLSISNVIMGQTLSVLSRNRLKGQNGRNELIRKNGKQVT